MKNANPNPNNQALLKFILLKEPNIHIRIYADYYLQNLNIYNPQLPLITFLDEI